MNVDILSHEFTQTEKGIMALLLVLLLALGYFQFVDRPVRRDLEEAAAEQESLMVDLAKINAEIAQYERMAEELANESIRSSRMPSYNASKEELALLNRILEPTSQYSITFANVTRSGDQIRRGFTLRFTVGDDAAARKIVTALARGELRCLLADVSYSQGEGSVSINMTGTFFETMVGGTPDIGLPADSAA